MEEMISKAEEEYSNFDKPKDMKMYAINLDYSGLFAMSTDYGTNGVIRFRCKKID